jgi:hypothetical protein
VEENTQASMPSFREDKGLVCHGLPQSFELIDAFLEDLEIDIYEAESLLNYKFLGLFISSCNEEEGNQRD